MVPSEFYVTSQNMKYYSGDALCFIFQGLGSLEKAAELASLHLQLAQEVNYNSDIIFVRKCCLLLL